MTMPPTGPEIPLLTEVERLEIAELLEHYPTRRTGSVESLLIVQRHRGWVSDEALAALADVLQMTPAELDSVATFYSRIYRRPVGRHVLAVCDSVSCFVMGGETLLAWLERRLGVRAGQTTADGAITLLPTVCLGHCDRAPAVLVDEEVLGPLDEAGLEALVSALAAEPQPRRLRVEG